MEQSGIRPRVHRIGGSRGLALRNLVRNDGREVASVPCRKRSCRHGTTALATVSEAIPFAIVDNLALVGIGVWLILRGSRVGSSHYFFLGIAAILLTAFMRYVDLYGTTLEPQSCSRSSRCSCWGRRDTGGSPSVRRSEREPQRTVIALVAAIAFQLVVVVVMVSTAVEPLSDGTEVRVRDDPGRSALDVSGQLCEITLPVRRALERGPCRRRWTSCRRHRVRKPAPGRRRATRVAGASLEQPATASSCVAALLRSRAAIRSNTGSRRSSLRGSGAGTGRESQGPAGLPC